MCVCACVCEGNIDKLNKHPSAVLVRATLSTTECHVHPLCKATGWRERAPVGWWINLLSLDGHSRGGSEWHFLWLDHSDHWSPLSGLLPEKKKKKKPSLQDRFGVTSVAGRRKHFRQTHSPQSDTDRLPYMWWVEATFNLARNSHSKGGLQGFKELSKDDRFIQGRYFIFR